MSLYARLLSRDDTGEAVDYQIPIHAFQALLSEVARGRITGQQAQAGVEDLSGAPLTPDEVTEAQALLASITGTAAQKLSRVKEIDDVLLLGQSAKSGPYSTPTQIAARLGG